MSRLYKNVFDKSADIVCKLPNTVTCMCVTPHNHLHVWQIGHKNLKMSGHGRDNETGTADKLFQVHCLF